MPFHVKRFRDRIEKRYTIEVVTPMFLGGSEKNMAEIRAASIKGLLRFWWRVLHPGKDMKTLVKEESEIFGATGDKQQMKSAFSLSIDDTGCQSQRKRLAGGDTFRVKNHSLSIFEYLAIGIFNLRTREYERAYYPPGTRFTIKCIYENISIMKEVEDSLSILLNYGGLGAKSRNGFGSLSCPEIGRIDIHGIPGIAEKEASPYTAISENSCFYEFKTHSSWEKALSEIGMAYRTMRLSKSFSGAKHNYDTRQYLALPLVQGKGEQKEKRHAKPCFLHVEKKPDGKYRGQILVMPYKYSGPVKNNKGEYSDMIKKMSSVFDDIQKGNKVETIY